MAITIYSQLKAGGYEPWMAVNDIPAGANYAYMLSEALEASAAVVVVMTQAAIESEHVKREVNIAIDRKIPLFPVNLSGKNDIVPMLTLDWKYWLSIVQILNCASGNSATKEILNAIERQGLELKTGSNQLHSNQTDPSPREKKAKEAEESKEQERFAESNRRQQEAERAEIERIAKQKLEREEELRKAEAQKRIQSAGPRIKTAEKVADWLEELSDWLADIVFAGTPEQTNFDLVNFSESFKKNFIVDLKGFEDLAVDVRSRIGRETLYIFRLLASNPALTFNKPEKVKIYLDLASEYDDPWAFMAQGEWLLVRGEMAKAKKYFLDPSQQELASIQSARAGELEANMVDSTDLIRTLNTPFSTSDSNASSQNRKLEIEKDFIYSWKWFEMLVQLADSKSKPDMLQKIFQEIDQVLYKDSAFPTAEVYLVPPLRIKWKLLGALVLYKLERNTAARNFLRGIDEKSEDYRLASGQIIGMYNMSSGEGANFFLGFVEVLESWR